MPSPSLSSRPPPNCSFGRFLAQAFESVLTQTYGNFEIIVTDDGSTDDSVEIVRRYARQDQRINAALFERNQ